jgi:hypothetical protein
MASMNGGSGGRGRDSRNKNQNRKVENSSFPADDLTGDKTVAGMLKKSKNPDSQK